MTSPTQNPRNSIGRRGLLAAGGTATAAGLLGGLLSTGSPASASPGSEGAGKLLPGKLPLAFGADGRFKVVQFNDTQDSHLTDKRTIELIETVLDTEQPGFALINGDVINGGPANATQVKQAINNVVSPMEERGIPWALAWGNHDEDSLGNGTGMTEPKILEWVHAAYDHNLNPAVDPDVHGESNAYLPIKSSRSDEAAFALWLLDSGRYAPNPIAGQSRDGHMNYDWIRASQIEWYLATSRAAEKRWGRKIPSLMYFHIPLFEHHMMWYDGQVHSDESKVAAAKQKHGIVGEKHEAVYFGAFNSGLYAVLHERGDVRGVFCGHDHVNTYVGNYYGIELGYGPGTGYGTYGLDGAEQHRLRGARVFELDESVEGVYAGTRNVFARDLGIDTTPGNQRLTEPRPLPR